ncbi:MAG: hypothetical protein ACPGLV_12300 [Bacteroidia bacterium]
MKKAFYLVSGFFLGLAPLIIASIIGFFFYVAFPNAVGISIIIVLTLLAVWIGINVFKKVYVIGPIEFLTAVHATPDLDQLIPTSESKTRLIKPDEYAQLILKGNHLFKGGSVRIFGEWFSPPHNSKLLIKSANFTSDSNYLSLKLSNNTLLEIQNPINLFESTTFLKISDAQKVKITWTESPEQTTAYTIEYIKKADSIKTIQQNISTKTPNVSIGKPALIIYS